MRTVIAMHPATEAASRSYGVGAVSVPPSASGSSSATTWPDPVVASMRSVSSVEVRLAVGMGPEYPDVRRGGSQLASVPCHIR